MSAAAAAPPRTLRVLLVDDSEDLRFLTRAALEQGGPFSVVGEAADGHEGIAAAERLQPDVVLLDISMPGLDGLEALPLVQAAAPGAAVVVLSGFEERRMGPAALGLGAVAYLEKGLSPKRLVATLLDVLGAPAPDPVPAPAPLPGGAEAPLSDDELFGVVAHDLRNPLTAIIAFGDTLMGSWSHFDDAQRRDVVGRMTRQARSMHVITSNLLASRSVALGAVAVRAESVHLAEVLPLVVEDLEPLAPQHRLELSLPRGLPAVRLDRSRLTQVLGNLVTNAARHAPEGTRIRLGAHAEATTVVLHVVDEGPGIPDAVRDRVFGKHVRLGPQGGLGLGLYVCAELVRAMRGSIWIADPGPGEGARVCVALPVAG